MAKSLRYRMTPALDVAARPACCTSSIPDLRDAAAEKVAGIPRFTPSTVTVLGQNPATKALTPELIRVAGGNNEPKVFSRQGSTAASAWVYALQAAKVSVTAFGVWLGHVYQWHIVTAAMLMTMFDNLSANHPVRKLLEPQSSYVIPFDNVLLLTWSSVVPPTSIATARQFVELMDLYAGTRQFFDDDPTTSWSGSASSSRLQRHERGTSTPTSAVCGHLECDRPLRQHVLSIEPMRPTRRAMGRRVQIWIGDSTNQDRGNVVACRHGFERCPEADPPQSRLPHHRAWQQPPLPRLPIRLSPSSHFPTLPADATIPDPTLSFDTKALLRFLPRTGTIGSMLHFYSHLGFDALRALCPDRGSRPRAVLRRCGEQSGVDRAAPLHRRLRRALRAGHASDMAVERNIET